MQKITFKNADGVSLEMTNRFPYLLQNLEGISSADIIVSNTTGYKQNGSTYLSTRTGTRPISFKLGVRGTNQQDLYERRRHVQNVFNPLLGEGVLVYENDFIKKQTNVVVDMMPNFTSDSQFAGLQWCTVSLIANNPFFMDVYETNVKMEDFVGGLRYPKRYPVQYAKRGEVASVIIEGDTDSPVVVEFRGPATEPKIENLTTGEYILIDETLLYGEKLIINTEFGKLSAEKIGTDGTVTDAFEYVDNLSTFFYLKRGLNKLKFSSTSGTPEVYLKYRNLFVGV